MNVTEDIFAMGSAHPLRSITRNEEQLLAPPHPPKVPVKLWRDHPLLEVVHYPQEFIPEAYAPPRGVYENDEIRVEWQKLDGRQPFYHRNCDVDEISYHIAGGRTLMTELGIIEFEPGELSRIPRGVAHDNYCRSESHLLFYIPATVAEIGTPIRSSEAILPPFPGWTPSEVNEAVTQCMGAVGHDITVFAADEERLLGQVAHEEERMAVFRADPDQSETWMFATDRTRLGMVTHNPGGERRYRRTVDADEIQYQAEGTRVVISQRGIVELQPGDFVRIPLGIAHASVTNEVGSYVCLQSHRELPQVAETSRTGEPYSAQLLADITTEV